MTTTQKTLLVTMDFPPLTGGIANYYYNRVKKMPADSVVVLMDSSSWAQASLPAPIRGAGYETCTQRTVYKKFFTKLIWPHWMPLICHVYKIAKKENIKMFWVGQVLPVGSAVWLVTKLLNYGIPKQVRDDKKLKFFVTCHGNDLLRAKSVGRKFKLAKKILQNAEYAEANTEFTKNILIKDFNIAQDMVKIVYPECTLSKNQVDKEKVKKLKSKFNLSNKKVLLTVARLVKSKGIDNVIKALPKVLEQIPNLVYMIVGDGPEMEELKKLAKNIPPLTSLKLPVASLNGVGGVIFTGNVPYNELPNYYALANLFILTPKKLGTDLKSIPDTESFGIVYLEAKEFGLPIIAGDVGGVREIKNSPPYEGGGKGEVNKITLVDSENVDEITNKIIKSLKHKNR